LITRITRDRETAEALTLDVFYDVWRQASRYGAGDGSVLGWIMNQARSRAIGHPQRMMQAAGSLPSVPGDVLRPSAALRGHLARRISTATGSDLVLPAASQWSEPEWEEVAPGISCKLLATDAEEHRVSMLVRLAPGTDYPPHTHAGVEELHLLDGELWIDDRKLYPGDYNRAEPDTSDARVWSETGCSCVLMTSTKDVLRGQTNDGDRPPSPAAASPVEMQPEDIYRATLIRAVELVGGEALLARRLQVPMSHLTDWLAGLDRPSMGTFLRVVDLVIEESAKPKR